MSNPKKFNIDFPVICIDVSENEQIVSKTGQSPVQRQTAKDAPTDWQNTLGSVSTRNLFALKNNFLADITLEVGPSSTPFQAHKLILALGSPVFEAMFYGPLAEVGEKVKIPDIMPDGFEVLLRFLYGDVRTVRNEWEALHAWIAAHKYCVLKLEKKCNRFFRTFPLSSSNVWKLLENAALFSLEPLFFRCWEYLERNLDTAITGNGFLETNFEIIKQLVQATYLIREFNLLMCVIQWARHKGEEFASLTDVFKPLLAHIRFGALTPSEFCHFLDETGNLLDKSDALAILKHLTRPSYHLPKWCCTATWHRGFGPEALSPFVPDIEYLTRKLNAIKYRTESPKGKEAKC